MDDEIEEVLRARDTSYWLLGALQSALDRDPVDALHDAQLLARLMKARADLQMLICSKNSAVALNRSASGTTSLIKY